MKLSIAVAQGRWEIAAHLVVIGMSLALLVEAARRHQPRQARGR